ncbi:glycosyltransferase family 9 protein [uncultured Pseudodesulfovibrio sp.]|uniref:glycosyltransferase family 9 protein n=1 Tax=uncultured Pseudodesulfovibrio sp. TaxID=2035858 RepID=UPI0029C88668|nr:glycosyltransferase family 9 protein [uncultured Pseudodesulfovibrio sp.]
MNLSADTTPKLVFRLGHMGDVALTTGVLSHWHETRGDTFIFLTRKGNGPLLENHPAIKEVVEFSNDQLRTGPWFTVAGELSRYFKGQPLIDLHGTLRSHILSIRWNGPVIRYPKFGLIRRLYDRTRSERFRVQLEATTVPQRYSMAFDKTPPPAHSLTPRIYLTDRERDAAMVRLHATGLHAPLVGLHPYATHPAKQWPKAHWLRLIELLNQAGMGWFIIGRNKESLMAENERDMTNQTNLRETCALLSRANLLVTGDSGPMHLACGVNTPVAAIFGPTARAWGFYPAGLKDRVIEQPLECRPCSLHGAKPCPSGFDCMTGITPDSVMQNVIAMLGDTHADKGEPTQRGK